MTTHPSLERLAQLAEGTLTDAERDEIRGHVLGCSECEAAVDETMRFRAAWQLGAGRISLTEAMQSAADSLPTRDRVVADSARASTRPAAAPRSEAGNFDHPAPSLLAQITRWISRPIPATLVMTTAVLLAFVLWTGTNGTRTQEPSPLLVLAVELSSHDGMVLPFANGAPSPETTYRAGGEASARLIRELDEMGGQLRDGNLDRSSAGWLISGEIATGRLRTARGYIDLASKQFPGEAFLSALAGVLEYRESDLAAAEREFRLCLENGEECPSGTAINLARVLIETGRVEEARSVLELAAESTSPDGSRAWAGRARQMLDQLPTLARP